MFLQAEDSARFFSKIVPSKFSLDLAIYHTCLQLYATTASLEEPLTNQHPYLHPPVELVEHVTSHVTSPNQSDYSQSHPHVALLRKYQELLADFTQGEVLLGLGLGECKQAMVSVFPEYGLLPVVSGLPWTIKGLGCHRFDTQTLPSSKEIDS